MSVSNVPLNNALVIVRNEKRVQSYSCVPLHIPTHGSTLTCMFTHDHVHTQACLHTGKYKYAHGWDEQLNCYSIPWILQNSTIQDAWLLNEHPPPLFSCCLWMCFAAGAVPMWLELQNVIKELQEEKKVSGDRLFLFWINRKTTRERFLPPVSTAMSFIPIWKSFELMYIHRRRRKKIYSDHVTKTIPPLVYWKYLRRSTSRERHACPLLESLNLFTHSPCCFLSSLNWLLFLLFFWFSPSVSHLMAFCVFLDTIYVLKFDKEIAFLLIRYHGCSSPHFTTLGSSSHLMCSTCAQDVPADGAFH